MQVSRQIRRHLSRQVVFRPPMTPVPKLHANSFVVLRGLSDSTGPIARQTASLGVKKPHWVLEWVTRIVSPRGRRKTREPASVPATTPVSNDSVQLALTVLNGGAWMGFWDHWIIDRAAQTLPRVKASPIVLAIDAIAAKLNDPDPDKLPAAISLDWNGDSPGFMLHFQEEH